MTKYQILWVGAVAYSFTDKQMGQKHEGFTRKAVILRSIDDVPVGIEIAKVSGDASAEMEVVTGAVVSTLYYDRFGRVCGAK